MTYWEKAKMIKIKLAIQNLINSSTIYKAAQLFLVSLLYCQLTHATVTRDTLHESVTLEYEKPFKVSVETDKPLHVGVIAKEFDCEEPCLQIERTYSNGQISSFSSQHGLNQLFEPIDGKIEVSISYLSPGTKEVSIYTEDQVCDSQACEVLAKNKIIYPYDYDQVDFIWKRAIIKELTNFKTSDDGSYSIAEGKTVFGTNFNLVLIWWFVDKDEFGGSCVRHIQNRADTFLKTGKGYSFSGTVLFNTETKELTQIMVELGCGNWDYEKQEEGFL